MQILIRPLTALFLSCTLLALMLASCPAEAWAMSIGTDPYLDLQANPGQAGESKLAIRNRGTEAVEIAVEVMDYSQSKEGMPEFSPSGSSPWGAGRWLDVQPSSFLLGKGEERTVTVRFQIPRFAKTHTYSAVILFRAETPAPLPGRKVSAARIIGKVGSLVLLRIKGKEEVRASGEIVLGRIPHLVLSLPAKLSIRYRNTGNIHTRVGGNITLQPFFGGTGTLDVPLVPRWVIPGSELNLEGELANAPLAGIYRVRTKLVDQEGRVMASTPLRGFTVIISQGFIAGLFLITIGLLTIRHLSRSRGCLPSEA